MLKKATINGKNSAKIKNNAVTYNDTREQNGCKLLSRKRRWTNH